MVSVKPDDSSNSILEWPIPSVISDAPAVKNRDLKAEHLHVQDPDAVLRTYVKMDRQEIIDEFTHLFRILHPFQFRGRGVEVGSGTATFSAMVCREYPEVDSIYAVEVVPNIVKLVQPIVARHIAGDASRKIVGVVGSFDDIRLNAQSCDFCIELGALHHSDNLAGTLGEIARVLKPGGHLVMLDRAHNNRLTDAQIELMLSNEYSEAWKRKNGYPPGRLTRRQNGEHEIRLKEWEKQLSQAGFEIKRRVELRPVGWKKFLRSCALEVPYGLRRWWIPDPMQVKPHFGETFWMFRHLTKLARRDSRFRPAIRKQSVFIARKV